MNVTLHQDMKEAKVNLDSCPMNQPDDRRWCVRIGAFAHERHSLRMLWLAIQNTEHDTSKIYQAADALRANCLLIDGSLLFSDASVWRPDVLDRIHKAFVATFDESNRYFVAKLIKAEA